MHIVAILSLVILLHTMRYYFNDRSFSSRADNFTNPWLFGHVATVPAGESGEYNVMHIQKKHQYSVFSTARKLYMDIKLFQAVDLMARSVCMPYCRIMHIMRVKTRTENYQIPSAAVTQYCWASHHGLQSQRVHLHWDSTPTQHQSAKFITPHTHGLQLQRVDFHWDSTVTVCPPSMKLNDHKASVIVSLGPFHCA